MKVRATIDEIELDGEYGPIAGVVAICTRCSHTTSSFGTQEPSVRRCLVLLREQCPRGEDNYYLTEDDVDEEEVMAKRRRAFFRG